MRRFSVFTLLYLAAAICLTAIAFKQPDSTPSLKKTLLVNAGLLYLFALLSTFRFWHQAVLNSQRRLREQPGWRQKLTAIAPGLIIAVTIVSCIFTVLTDRQTTDVIPQAVSGLTVILLCVEWLFTRHQI
ncbi:hypothetical protein PI95_028565 [Hassallia byssoidea VB512170]|uniref:Uncharacterized protein n=1 Tax=Hassallia byssoidea VB512170 TaxID=1304833 RepID=A0A846HG73_9CYAN|nr:hypothetical protein [Hassalia byssoidea]NEU76362.1 hypothetical protein [Hassalia byssoidea VB512170]